MKFQIESVQACGNAWRAEDRFEEMLKLYPYLKDKITKLPNNDRNIITINDRNIITIEINTLKELNDLVNGCRCRIVYDATNDVDSNGVNGIITIYDDYME